MSDYRCPECHANLPRPTSHHDKCSLAGMEYSEALTVNFVKMLLLRLRGLPTHPDAVTANFVKMLLETVKGGGKVVTFNDGDIDTMERILKENAKDLPPANTTENQS